MQFDKDRIHKSLFDATEKYSSSLIWTGGQGFTGEHAKIVAQHQGVWWKENGVRFGAYFFGWLVTFFSTIALKPYVTKPFLLLLLFLILFGGIGLLALWYSKEKRKLSVKELEVLLPVLDLTPIQRSYAECLLAMEGFKMDKDQKNEILEQLNRLLDEEERLLQVRDDGHLHARSQETILEERDGLRTKLEKTTDAVTRNALQKGLDICERRLAAAQDLSLTDQRVEAQLAMIGQAMSGVRDSLVRLHASPTASISDLNLDHLNDSVALAHGHAEALEAAVAEVRTLG